LTRERAGQPSNKCQTREDTAQAKMAILRECGITVCESPALIGKTMADVLKKVTV